MKGSLAAMIVAAEEYVKANPNHKGTIALLITSDEEAAAKDGTIRVVETLMARGEKITYCMVGEPSSSKTLGDVVKMVVGVRLQVISTSKVFKVMWLILI